MTIPTNSRTNPTRQSHRSVYPFFVLITLAFFLTGTPVVQGRVFRMAFICSGSITDGGWNQDGRDAAVKVAKALHAKLSVLEHVTPIRATSIMRDFCRRHYGLIIGHGYEFLVPATQVARMTTHTRFAISGADKVEPGVTTMNFDLTQPSYELGALAAMISRTGKIGFIGGEAIPSVEACYKGFKAGARAVNPKIRVAQAYTSWDQVGLSKTQAQAFIQQGIDVIYQNVDAASQGVFEAVKSANRRHPGHPVYVFGCNGNQNNNPTCSRYTLASAVIRLDRAFMHVAILAKAGKLKAGVINETMANHVCIVVLNPKLLGRVITPAMEHRLVVIRKHLLAAK